jgi:hypothetical protein
VAQDDLELAALRLAWRVDALDKWRERVEHRLDSIEAATDAVIESQKIAAGVAAELARRGVGPSTLSLTWWQKLGGAVAGALLVADALRGLVGG